MANRALQAKALKLKKQNAARPYQLETRDITLKDGERFIPGARLTPKTERVTSLQDITPKGNGPARTPIFNATDWAPASRLYRNGVLVA